VWLIVEFKNYHKHGSLESTNKSKKVSKFRKRSVRWYRSIRRDDKTETSEIILDWKKKSASGERERIEKECQRIFYVPPSASISLFLSLNWPPLHLSSSADLSCPTSCSLFEAGRSFAVVNGVATTCRRENESGGDGGNHSRRIGRTAVL